MGGGGAAPNGNDSPDAFGSGGGGNGAGGQSPPQPANGGGVAAQPGQSNSGASINVGYPGGDGTIQEVLKVEEAAVVPVEQVVLDLPMLVLVVMDSAPPAFRNPKASYGTPGPGSTYFWFAGGGGGGNFGQDGGAGGVGGGGTGADPGPGNFNPVQNGVENTGGGGGGGN